MILSIIGKTQKYFTQMAIQFSIICCQNRGHIKIQYYRPSGRERDSRCPYAKRFTCTATQSSGMFGYLHLRNTVKKYTWEIHLRNALEKYTWEIHLRNTLEKYTWEIHIRNTLQKYTWEIHLRNALEKYTWEIQFSITHVHCTVHCYKSREQGARNKSHPLHMPHVSAGHVGRSTRGT